MLRNELNNLMDARLIKTPSDNTFFLERESSKRLATKNLVPGSVYGEKLITIGQEEYRIWDPYRSKLSAIIFKGSTVSIKSSYSVLYLGAANGTTVSHVSDIVSEGTVFAIEFSERTMKDLIKISIKRANLVPILADVRHPESYKNMVPLVDIIYQDVAQRDQAEIAIRNAELFLKKDGLFILMIKSRSIDSTRQNYEVIDEEIKKLNGHFKIYELLDMEPFQSDHKAAILTKLSLEQKIFSKLY